MTHVEFDRWAARPENADRRHERLDGRVLEFPPHKRAHGFVCGRAAWAIRDHSRRTGFGQAFVGSGVLLARGPDTVLGPDVSLFARKRSWDELTAAAARPGYDDAPPLLVAEVLCAEDEPAVVARKLAVLLAAGVRAVWVLDPPSRALTVHRTGTAPRVLSGADELTGGAVLPGFACPVAEFFGGR